MKQKGSKFWGLKQNRLFFKKNVSVTKNSRKCTFRHKPQVRNIPPWSPEILLENEPFRVLQKNFVEFLDVFSKIFLLNQVTQGSA